MLDEEVGGLGVVFGRWGKDGPWLGGSGGLSLVVVMFCYFYIVRFCVSGVPPPLGVVTFFFLV